MVVSPASAVVDVVPSSRASVIPYPEIVVGFPVKSAKSELLRKSSVLNPRLSSEVKVTMPVELS